MNRKIKLWFLLFALVGCNSKFSRDFSHLSGMVEMTEHKVGSRVSGKLVEVRFEEGEEVKRGQILATMERYAQAERDLVRARESFKKGGATKQNIETAQLTLDDQRITSPVDGIVLTKVHEVGDVIPSGGVAAVIGDQYDMWVRVFVPEGHINQIAKGQKATITLDGVDGPLDGEVSFISPKAEFTPRNVQTPDERVLQMFSIKVRFLSPNKNIHPGSFADVTIHLNAS